MAGEAVEQLELSEQVFGVTPNMAVLHQVVTAQLVNRRQGNASTKTRAEVSGGNKKPYKQKGTGRARQGSTRSPQFRHGGVVFGPKPHPYHHDVPRKMRRLAIRSALSDKVANEKLIVLSDLALEAPRTKDMIAILGRLPLEGKRVLMMLPQRDENIVLSLRNIPLAKVQHVSSINVVELLKHDCLIMPLQTVRWLEMVFGEGMSAEEASFRTPTKQCRMKKRLTLRSTTMSRTPTKQRRMKKRLTLRSTTMSKTLRIRNPQRIANKPGEEDKYCGDHRSTAPRRHH
jgi:large subunit ribosomal protein L4